jgi:hypothetical protein
MNQDQVKEKLLQIETPEVDVSVIFSGKTSYKVDGLYKPKSRQIIIHNKNFIHEDELLYTAIHEYAHHLHFTRSALPISSRAHTSQFWSIFHSLLDRAEEMGIYRSIFDLYPEFSELTKKIRHDIFSANGSLMIELGALLKKASALCGKYHVSFEDYLDRILNLPKTSARVMMQAHEMDLDPAIGFENMRLLTRIKERGRREEAQAALLEGQSPDTVKNRYLNKQEDRTELQVLESEKMRIERTIQSLKTRLAELNRRIAEAKRATGPVNGVAGEAEKQPTNIIAVDFENR